MGKQIDDVCRKMNSAAFSDNLLQIGAYSSLDHTYSGRRFELPATTNNSAPGGTPYDSLYGEAPPERGTFFMLKVHERIGISLV